MKNLTNNRDKKAGKPEPQNQAFVQINKPQQFN